MEITDRNKTALVAVIAILMAIAFWWVHSFLVIDADAPRYLANDPMRAATYPLFLNLSASKAALLIVQLSFFAAALSWIAVFTAKFLPLLVSAALVLAIGANPYLWELQASITSEALTTPLLILVISCVIGFAASGRRRRWRGDCRSAASPWA